MALVRRRGVARGVVALALVASLVCVVCVMCMPTGLPDRAGGQDIEEAADEVASPDGGTSEPHDGGRQSDGLPVTESLQLPEDMDWVTDLVAGGEATTREQEGSVEEVAASVLSSYRDRGDCVLASSGYLDLLGSVWSCVVRGGGWADVCIVSGDAEAGRCQVATLRIGRDEVVRLLEEGRAAESS